MEELIPLTPPIPPGLLMTRLWMQIEALRPTRTQNILRRNAAKSCEGGLNMDGGRFSHPSFVREAQRVGCNELMKFVTFQSVDSRWRY